MKTLDTLTTLGSELTTEQLDNVDGGFLVIATIIVLGLVDGAIWDKVLTGD